MRLVKLPIGNRTNHYYYVNPDNVTYLYENESKTYIVTVDTGEDDSGLCIALPMDEVAERLVNGNFIYDVIQELKTNNEEDES